MSSERNALFTNGKRVLNYDGSPENTPPKFGDLLPTNGCGIRSDVVVGHCQRIHTDVNDIYVSFVFFESF